MTGSARRPPRCSWLPTRNRATPSGTPCSPRPPPRTVPCRAAGAASRPRLSRRRRRSGASRHRPSLVRGPRAGQAFCASQRAGDATEAGAVPRHAPVRPGARAVGRHLRAGAGHGRRCGVSPACGPRTQLSSEYWAAALPRRCHPPRRGGSGPGRAPPRAPPAGPDGRAARSTARCRRTRGPWSWCRACVCDLAGPGGIQPGPHAQRQVRRVPPDRPARPRSRACRGARRLEGHATATVGPRLRRRGGDRAHQEALAIAEEVADHDDVGRAYACLSTSLDFRRLGEAEAVAAEGAQRLRALGMGANQYGTFLQMNAVDELAQLGRWDEALRMAIAIEPIARGTRRIVAAQQYMGRIYALRGQLDMAGAGGHRYEDTAPGTEAQFNGPLAVNRLELAAWTGDIDGAGVPPDESLPILVQTARPWASSSRRPCGSRPTPRARPGPRATTRRRPWRCVRPTPCWRGRGRSTTSRCRPPTACWSGWRSRLPRRRPAGPRASPIPRLAAGRGGRGPTPDRTSTSPRTPGSGRRRRCSSTGPRGTRRRRSLGLANATRRRSVPSRSARRSRRSRPGPPRPGGPHGRGRAGGARRRTARIPEGLAARYDARDRGPAPRRDRRTNRQIGEVLFMSESTAGVHVSHILGKLGCRARRGGDDPPQRRGLDA